MADKTQIRKNFYRLKTIKTWQLLLVLVLMLFVTATFLRLNNVGMKDRRTAVLSADQAGNTVDIEKRLYDLQRFSAAHMNANTGPFYLEHQYDRDVKTAMDRAANSDNPNGNINAQADAVCRPQFGNSYSLAYQQCILNELSKYPPSQIEDTPKLPDPNLYRHDFRSPLWSSDFAGWSALVCVVIVVVIFARLIMLGVLKLLLKRRYRDV